MRDESPRGQQARLPPPPMNPPPPSHGSMMGGGMNGPNARRQVSLQDNDIYDNDEEDIYDNGSDGEDLPLPPMAHGVPPPPPPAPPQAIYS